MITLTREEAQQVLDAFYVATTHFAKDRNEILAAIQTLRARLAQPEPEPVAWTVGGLITDFSRDFSAYKTKTYTKPLYTAPPQREWQGLTDEERTYLAWESNNGPHCVAMTEALLKEKNA